MVNLFNMFPRIINDNVPELLRARGDEATIRPATDNKEFFQLLKEKIKSDLDTLSQEADIIKKAQGLVDIRESISEFVSLAEQFLTKTGKTFAEIEIQRKQRLGGFTKRLVLEGIKKKALEQ